MNVSVKTMIVPLLTRYGQSSETSTAWGNSFRWLRGAYSKATAQAQSER